MNWKHEAAQVRVGPTDPDGTAFRRAPVAVLEVVPPPGPKVGLSRDILGLRLDLERMRDDDSTYGPGDYLIRLRYMNRDNGCPRSTGGSDGIAIRRVNIDALIEALLELRAEARERGLEK